jgi:hypothetical protein
MRVAEAAWCSALAAAAGEPLIGTASRIRRWLLVEQPGRWGHDALADSGFPPGVGEHLQAEGERHGVRVLLIKRRDRSAPARRQCFAAFTGRRDRTLHAFEVDDPRDLADLDLSGIDRRPRLGRPVAGPLVLVCTHGKHDSCCARLGGPLYRSLAARPEVWEATHVGGDRFAGNLVCFPHGVYFGRVTPDVAARVVDDYSAGILDLEHFRGRSSFPPAAQVAEHHLRRVEALTGVEDVRLVAHARTGPRAYRVGLRVPSGEVVGMVVEELNLPARLLTCKATHPHHPRGYVVWEMG